MAEERKLFNPISFDDVDPRIVALGPKSAEEKIYIVLYERTDDDNEYQEFMICKGREDCYRSIERLLNTYNVAIHRSVVLVEVPGINRSGTGEWFIKNPSGAPSIYQFCKITEKYFGDTAFDIEEFNDGSDETAAELSMEDLHNAQGNTIAKSEADVFGGSQEMADLYNEAMKDK